jgi:hypothetical protein
LKHVSSYRGKELRKLLQDLLALLPADEPALSRLAARDRRNLETLLGRVQLLLSDVAQQLDPVQLPEVVFDPSHPEVVARIIADTLLIQPRQELEHLKKFYGSGVYALYYRGSFSAYAPLIGFETPIYVGKADPAVPGASDAVRQGMRLWSRLNDHKKSVDAALNLAAHDFEYRYLVVKSAWQATAETYLIDYFRPVWNKETKICYGFGKHGDDPKTRGNTRSPWDTLHPGRSWATKPGNVVSPLDTMQILGRIADHFLACPPITRPKGFLTG